MEAKRTMQEMEDDVVKKFSALNKQYENINGKLLAHSIVRRYSLQFTLFQSNLKIEIIFFSMDFQES